MERVSWSDLKTFIDARSLSAQFVEYSNFYKVWAFDGPMFFSSLIKKTSPVNADQTDFETNYKFRVKTVSKACGTRLSQILNSYSS